MKSVIISIQPKWCELIARGKKTVEVRKSRPKIKTPFKCYIYCTKPSKKHQSVCGCVILNNDELYRHPEQGIKHGNSIELMLCDNYTSDNFLNGKVIGEFVCDRIYQYSTCNVEGIDISDDDMTKCSCLSKGEIEQYETSAEPKENCIYCIGVYGWHISELVIYDKPKELSDYSLKRPPQSWRYIYI